MGEGQPASPDELLTQKPSNDLRSHGVAVHDGGVDQHDRPLVQQKAAAQSDQAPGVDWIVSTPVVSPVIADWSQHWTPMLHLP